jgi:hypothetical protein
MPIALLAAAAFAAGVVYNLVHGHWPDVAFGSLLAGALVWLHLAAKRTRRERIETLRWFLEHEAEIRSGGARLGPVVVTPRTRVHEMTLCVSALLVTVRHTSAPVVEGRDSVFGTGFTLSVLSFLFGWWGLPWGPIFTVQTLARNLRGGKVYTVDELLGLVHAARG